MSPYEKFSRDVSLTNVSNSYGYINVPSAWEYYQGCRPDWSLQMSNGWPNLPPRYENVPGSEMDRLATLVSTSVLSQSGRGATEMWENVAELNKTFDTLNKPLASWWRFSRKAKVATAALSTANAWLVYRYGIKPLVSSVADAYNELKKEIRHERQAVRAKEYLGANSMTTFDKIDPWDSFKIGIQKTESHEVRAMSLEEVDVTINWQAGLTAKSLLTLPWELVPYSFVVDWFVNAGDYFGALAGFLNPRSLGSCITYQTAHTTVWQTLSHTSTNPSSTKWYLVSPQLDILRQDCVWKTRTLGLGSPGIAVRPSFKFDKAVRVADALALVANSILTRFGR